MTGVVQRFTARVKVQRRAQAAEAQDILSAFVRERLPALLDEAAAEGAALGDRLELNLGVVRARDLPARAEAEIRKRLSAPVRAPGEAARPNPQPIAVDGLRLMLATGRAPPHGDGDLESQLSTAMKADPAGTRRLLAELAQSPVVAERLQRQLPTEAPSWLAAFLRPLYSAVEADNVRPAVARWAGARGTDEPRPRAKDPPGRFDASAPRRENRAGSPSLASEPECDENRAYVASAAKPSSRPEASIDQSRASADRQGVESPVPEIVASRDADAKVPSRHSQNKALLPLREKVPEGGMRGRSPRPENASTGLYLHSSKKSSSYDKTRGATLPDRPASPSDASIADRHREPVFVAPNGAPGFDGLPVAADSPLLVDICARPLT